MTELIGSRVMLRPLRQEDWDAWREVRLRCRVWLERWEPRPDAGSIDPAVDREAFQALFSNLPPLRGFFEQLIDARNK